MHRYLYQQLISEYEQIQSHSLNFKNVTIKPSIENQCEWKFSIIPTRGTYKNYLIDGIIKFCIDYKQNPPNILLSTNIPHSSVLSFNHQHLLFLDTFCNKSNEYSLIAMVQELSIIFNVELPTTPCIEKRISNTLNILKNMNTIYTLNNLPNVIKNECIKNNINNLNELQLHIMNDLCIGNDCIVVSSGGSGKSISVIISSLYRLLKVKKPRNRFNAPLHCIVIVRDHIKVQMIGELAQKLGDEIIPHFRIFRLYRNWHFVSRKDIQSKSSRNLFICTMESAVNLFEKWGEEIINNLITINIMDFDNLIMPTTLDKMEKIFKCIPHEMNINIFSNSWYRYLDETVKKLIGYKHKHYILNKYKKIEHYFIDCDDKIKLKELIRFCQSNENGKGIIFCGQKQGEIVENILNKNGIKCVIFGNEFGLTANRLINKFNDGQISYLIASKYSPIHMLWKCIDLQFIINYELLCFQWYFKRISITSNKIKIVSLIDNSDERMYELLTESSDFELLALNNDYILQKQDEDEKCSISSTPPPGFEQVSKSKEMDDIKQDEFEDEIKETPKGDDDIDDIDELKHDLAVKNEQIKTLQEQINHVNAMNFEQQNNIQTLEKQLKSAERNKINKNGLNLELLVENIDNEVIEMGRKYDLDEIKMSDKNMLKQRMNELDNDINHISRLKIAVSMLDNYSIATKQFMESLIIPNPLEYINWNINEMIIWISSIEGGRFKKYCNVLRNGFISDGIISGQSLLDITKCDLRVEPFNIKSFDDRRDLIQYFKSLQTAEGL